MVVKRVGAGLRRSCLSAFVVPFALLLSPLSLHAETIVIGAIDCVDLRAGSFTALGQTIQLAGAHVVNVGASASDSTPAAMRPGQSVWIDAEVTASGAKVHVVYLMDEQYVPGSTSAFVAGRVSHVSRTGTLRIGTLVVDFTAALADGALSVSAGDWVQLVGTQPAEDGLFVAEQLIVKSGVGGTGTLGVGGTGKLGVGGTGRSGVGGTGIP